MSLIFTTNSSDKIIHKEISGSIKFSSKKTKKFEAGIIYQNRFRKFLIVGLIIIVLLLVIPPCSSHETNSSDNGDIQNNFAFSFFDNGTTVRTNISMFGNPDADRDTLNDEWENAAINELSPSFSLERNEDFLKHPEDQVRLFGRSTPFPSPENPRYIVFWYISCLEQRLRKIWHRSPQRGYRTIHHGLENY